MPFKSFLQKSAANVNRFFNTALPKATRSGVRFFNSSLVPALRQIHHVQSAITHELKTNEVAPQKLKHAAEKAHAFSTLGLQKLEHIHGGVNRIADRLGLSGPSEAAIG